MKKYRLRRIGVASNEIATAPSLSDCIELVLGEVDALGGDVIDALKVALGPPGGEPFADDADPDIQQAVTVLVAESKAVFATFDAELRLLVYQSGSYDFALSPLGRVEDIHVFDIRELETHIEMALARQEVMRAVEEVLPQFDGLISALMGWTSVQSGLNPLKPDAFVRALNETLNAWVPNEQVRMTLLRPASIALGTGLQQLYREACDWLRSRGVEPVEPPASKPLDGASARSKLVMSEVDRTMQTFEKLRRLLAGESLYGGGAVRDFTHTVPASMVALQDLRLVEPMMRRLIERSTSPQGPPPPTTGSGGLPGVPGVRSQAENQQIGRQLGDEVVRMMLDQLVLDERLPVPVRMQLRALEPVLMHMATSDPRFFIDRAHPARQLLDRVAQRSLAYARDDEQGIHGFVACVAYAVNALSQGPSDAAACASVLEALEQDWSAFDDMRRRQRDEAFHARQHTEQRMLLAQRFSGAMMERFRNSAVPELVAGFLRGPWSQVLAESQLLHASEPAAARENPDPRGYLALVDDLVWSVQLPLIRLDYPRLVRLIPRLLSRLNEGLVLIRYPQEPISIFLDQLSALHEQVMAEHRAAVAAARAAQAASGGPDTVAVDDVSPDSSIGAALGPEAPEPAAPAGDADLAVAGVPPIANLVVGASVELLLAGEWVPAQLTWIGHNSNLFMFVSGAGLAHAMTRRTMDRLETQGRIRVVAAAPVIELDLDLDLDQGRGNGGAADPAPVPPDTPA